MFALASAMALSVLTPSPDGWATCMDETNAEAIVACEALVGENEALARYNRGNAWRALAMRRKALAEPSGGPDPFDMAISDYGRALELRPDLAEALVNRGIVWFEKHRYDRAIADYDAAIALRPELAEAWNNRSLAWHRAGRYDLALKDFDQTIRLYKNYGNALINRAIGPRHP